MVTTETATEEFLDAAYRKPPKGYKNIDLVKRQMNKLEQSIKDCNPDTPALTLSSARWLENAFYSREIIEEDYDKLMAKIKEQTRKFMNSCRCLRSH